MKNVSTQAVTRQIKVPFHGADLYVVEHNGQPYTPMKPIVDAMGLDWKSQHVKLTQRFGSTMVEITMVAEDGRRRLMSCMPVKKLPGWLHSINVGKVRAELRETVAAYQAECDDALWQYWNDGIAVNPRMAFSVNAGDVLTGDQQETLRLMVKTLVERLPKSKQGGAATRVWSKLKAHFKVSYRQIPQLEFPEAVSIVTRTAAEWEVVEPEPEPAPLDSVLRTNIEAVCCHMRFLKEWWREFGPAIHAMNPNTAAVAYDHFQDGSFAAALVGKQIGYQFPVEYARSYPWRGTHQDRADHWRQHQNRIH